MKNQNKIKLFEDKKVRTLWNEGEEQWYFSIIDIIAILTEQENYQGARNYWKVLKHRLIKEGNETVTNCNQLKIEAEDGKMRLTDVATTEQLLRLIQSIPSKKLSHLNYGLPKLEAKDWMKCKTPKSVLIGL